MATRRQDSEDKKKDSKDKDEPQCPLVSSLANLNIDTDKSETRDRKEDQASGAERRRNAFRIKSRLSTPESSSHPPHPDTPRPRSNLSSSITPINRFKERQPINADSRHRQKSEDESRSASQSRTDLKTPPDIPLRNHRRNTFRSVFGRALSDETLWRPQLRSNPIEDQIYSFDSFSQERRIYNPTSSKPLGIATRRADYQSARLNLRSSPKRAEQREKQTDDQDRGESSFFLSVIPSQQVHGAYPKQNLSKKGTTSQDQVIDTSDASKHGDHANADPEPAAFQIGSDPSDPLGIAFPPVYDAHGAILPWVHSLHLRPDYVACYSGIDAASFRHIFKMSTSARRRARATAFENALQKPDPSLKESVLGERRVATPNVRNAIDAGFRHDNSGMLGSLVASVCIYNLTDEAEESELLDIFSGFGPIQRLTIVRRPTDNSSQNYALCTFYHNCHAHDACTFGRPLYYQGRMLCILWPHQRYNLQHNLNRLRPIRMESEEKEGDSPELDLKPRAASI